MYLFLLFAGILATGILVTALAPFLPYGRFALHGLVASVAASLVPAFFLVRAQALSRTLVSGELLRMDPVDLPRLEGHTFLGFSFLWKPRHAERLYHLMSRGQDAPEETQALFGGNTLIHGLGGGLDRPLLVDDRKRTHHMLVLGSPGEGKTRFLDLLVRQLVEKDDVVIIVDPKGDERLINMVRQVCEETGRGHQFRLFALPWPSASAAYNPLSRFGSPSDIADRLIGIFPPAGGEAEAFRGFQWGATKSVVQAMYLAGIPITIARILRYLRNMEELAIEFVERKFPDLSAKDVGNIASKYDAAVAGKKMPRSIELDDLLAYLRLDPSYYLKMVGSFLPQLERLSAGIKRELLSPEPRDTEREILTWPAADNQKLVLYFYLGSLHGEESADAVGKMLLLDLQAYVAARYSYPSGQCRHRLSLIVDEAHHMISKPFLNILAEGRGADIAVVLSTQTTAQFEQTLGSRAAVDEILTQNWAHIQFQTRNPREAQDFSDLAGERQMRVIGESHRYEPAFFSSGLNQVDDFRAQFTTNIQYKDAALVPTWAIAQLPTFHYFARIGGRLYKGRIPLLTDPVATYTQDIQKGAAA